uniref:Uncharacterized protein n=1 Tax=Picea glauca TaxID=3330 RepID=A0A124GNV1_PICGL|nr:hypothetical protein ABT39_MTgene3185 [Picea glauca]QHR86150.1 hypothetical protein Q903MT_gene149 [Picea sitchensis]
MRLTLSFRIRSPAYLLFLCLKPMITIIAPLQSGRENLYSCNQRHHASH